MDPNASPRYIRIGANVDQHRNRNETLDDDEHSRRKVEDRHYRQPKQPKAGVDGERSHADDFTEQPGDHDDRNQWEEQQPQVSFTLT